MQYKNITKLVASLLVCCSGILIFAGNDARADVPENQIAEVNHLINFVKTSDCVLNRNGTDHSGEKSVAHIQKKYNYFRKKIKSTEDFIEYSATKSTMSGKYYTVTCPSQKAVRSQDWLLKELERFRSTISVKTGSKNSN